MADAQFVINVAATFTGEQTLAQTDALQSKLAAAGVTTDTLQEAIVRLSRAQEAAAGASAAANKALAAGNAEYASLEQTANQAAKALEKVSAGSKGVVDVGAYRAAASAAKQAAAALDAQGKTLVSLEGEAKKAAAGETALAASMKNVKTLAGEHAKAIAKTESAESSHDRQLKKTAGALNGLGGPFGKVGALLLNAQDDFGDMSKTMGSSAAAAFLAVSGIAAIGIAVAAVTIAIAAGTLAIAGWAVGLADARRNMALSRDAAEALDPSLIALHGTFDDLTNETGESAAELTGFKKQLKAAQVSVRDMPGALRAVALEEAALGKGGSADFFAKLQTGRQSVLGLANDVQNKLGPIVSKQMLSLSNQSGQFKQNISQLFGGLNIDPVLSGFSKLVALFDQNTAAGKAMQFLFEKVFQPLIDQADNAATVVEAFVLGFLIGLTKLYIAAKPAIKAISEFFGLHDPSLTDTLAAVTKAGEYVAPAFLVLVAILGAFAVAIGVVAAAAVGIQIAIYAMVAAVVYAGVKIVEGVIGAWNSVTSFLSGIDLATIGGQIIQGLANGILGAGGAVLHAIGGVVTGAIDGAKDLLGIHSPSKVFADIGGHTAEGFAQGVDEGAPEAQGAVSNLVAAPSPGAAPSPQSAGGSSGISIVVEAGAIVIQGVQGAAQAAVELKGALIDALEQYAAQATGATQ